MKNVIYILVDALSYHNVGAREYRNSPTPFIDSLMNKSLSCTNMFSQAPYTEAAFISNICGENTLDNGGYLLGLSKTNKIYPMIFKENGYKTFSSFSPYVYSKSYVEGVDQYYYTRVFSIAPLMLYRIEYYKDKYQGKTITEKEYKICNMLLEESLVIWLNQLKEIKNKDEATKLIYDLINNIEVLDKAIEEVETELTKLKASNDNSYMKKLFEEWKEHKLFKIVNLNITNKQSEEFKLAMTSKYKDDLSLMQNINNNMFKANNKIDFKYLFDLAKNDEDGFSGSKRTFKTYLARKSDEEIKNAMLNSIEKEKITVSAHRQLEYLANKIIELDKKDEKNFTFLHLEDFHLPSMFYSYDIEDEKAIKSEIELALNYANNVPQNYRGSLIADLSTQYVDYKLKNFFEKLSKNLKNEFTIVVTADHGYPCNFNPPRPIIYNALYQENYHIPFILYSSNKEGKIDNGLHSSLDIMPTLLESCGIKYEGKYGDNLVGEKERQYVLIEYPGPGCPDIAAKKVFYAIYNGKYKIGIKSLLSGELSKEDVVCIYNISTDKDEKQNLIKKEINNSEVEKLINIVKVRHSELGKRFNGDKFIDFMLSEGKY